MKSSLMILLVLTSSLVYSSPLFRYVDAQGFTTLSDAPEIRLTNHGHRIQYRPYVVEAARASGVSVQLIEAVITAESNWQRHAVSVKGAQGLMQLMPATARDWGLLDPFNPRENILAGTRYLRYLLDLFDQDLSMAVAAYHAGEGRVLHDGRIPEIPATQNYVQTVLRHYARFEQASLN